MTPSMIAAGDKVRISVVIPTYRRVPDLKRCLEALGAQTIPPYELIVVFRDTDVETGTLLSEWVEHSHPFLKRLVVIKVPGQIQALRAGAGWATGDVVAFTDDDAAPHPDWIARISAHYADPEVGGVGGRDLVHDGAVVVPAFQPRVGLVTWFGRVIGNHHCGLGDARAVQILKGVNMSFRRELLEFDLRLRGEGAQPHNDMALSLHVWSLGWKLIYDPSVLVDHHPAIRHDGDQRHKPSRDAMENAAFNLAYVLRRDLRPPQRYIRIAYGLLVGDAGVPGLGRALLALSRRETRVLGAFLPSLTGQLKAIFDR